MAVGSDRASLLIEAVSEACGSWRNAFAAVGVGIVAGYGLKTLYGFCKGLHEHFYGAVDLQNRLKQYGEWAVVTGCTRGMGREFACQLASFGLNVVLIGRNEEALLQLSKEIENKFNVYVIRVRVDFNSGQQIYSDIADMLSTKDVGILVNNVGVMYEYPQYFHLVPEEKLEELVNVNISSAQILTHMVLRECFIPKKRGLVVFMSSGACFYPTPQMSAYAATKKHLGYFSKSLAAEMDHLKLNRVKIQSLTPMYVATQMTAYSKWIGTPCFLLSPDAKTYVRHALWTLGRCQESTGYWPHSLQLWFAGLLPEILWIFAANTLLSYFRNMVVKEKY